MTWADGSGKGSYLMMFCLLRLIYDLCYELVLIMIFGFLSETGWEMFLAWPLGEF